MGDWKRGNSESDAGSEREVDVEDWCLSSFWRLCRVAGSVCVWTSFEISGSVCVTLLDSLGNPSTFGF